MDRLQERIDLLGRSLALLASYALIVGAISIIQNIGGLADGEVPAAIRLALGVVGVAAGLLVWTLRRVGIDGWQALMAWSVAQVPFVAWSVDGNALRQLWDVLLGISSETTVNGVVTSSEHYGLNAVGIVLAIWSSRTRERWDRTLKPVLGEAAPVPAGTI